MALTKDNLALGATEDEQVEKPKEWTPRRKTAAKPQSHGEADDSNWLISYSDMMTLLMAFFVLLCSFSTPNAEKLERLKRITAKSLGVKYTKPYEELSLSIQNLLTDFNLQKDVTILQTDEGLTITSKGTLFFDSGLTELKPKARELIERIAAILVADGKDFRVTVEGHTDDVPIVSKQFPSNWELSANRASTVVRLLEAKGFPHEQLKPVGLADTEPLVPNRDAGGHPIALNQARNRRIVLRILRPLVEAPTK